MDAFSLIARISLDSSEYDKGLNNSKSKLSSVGGALKSGFGTIAKVGAAAFAAAEAAVGAFVGSSIKAGAQFDTSMSQVAATLGLTMDEMSEAIGKVETDFGTFEGNLRDFAQFMGKNTAFSATEAADALNYMALAGYDAQQSMDMLPNVLNLAAAGAMDLALASDMITDSQSALGLSFDQTNTLVDQMAKTASKSNTSVSQLGSAILTVGGTAKNLVGGTTELNTALGILADNGIKGSEGGTKLRNMILSLSAPSDTASVKLEQLGVSAFDADGNMRPLNETFGDMAKALDGVSQQDRMEFISAIFNARDIKAAEAMLANYGDRWNELSGYIDEAEGAAAQMAATQLDNLNGDITLFKSALEGAQIAISDGLTPQLREFVQFGTDGLGKLTDAFNEGGLSGAMGAFGEILADGLNMIIESLPQWIDAGMQLLGAFGQGMMDNIHTILFAAGDIMEMFFDTMLQATKGSSVVMDIITTILGVFEENYMTLMDVGAQILINIINGITEGLPDLLFYAGEIIEHFGEVLIENLPLLIESAAQLILTLATGIAEALPDLIPTIVEVVIAIVEALIDNVDLLIDAAIALIMGLAEGLINALPVLLDKAPEIITKLVEALVDNIPKLIEAAADLIIALVLALTDPNNLLKLAKAAVEMVVALAKGIVEMQFKMVETAISLVTKLVNAIGERANQIKEAGKKIIDFVQNGIKEKIEQAKTWGKDLIQNFISGIKEKFNALKDSVSNVASTVKSFLGFSEPEEGPLSNFHTYAPDMMQLFAKGIKDNERLVTDQLEKSFDFSDVLAEQTVNVGASGSFAGSGNNTSYGDITVNVYGAEGQNINDLADAVSYRLQHLMNVNGAVYA